MAPLFAVLAAVLCCAGRTSSVTSMHTSTPPLVQVRWRGRHLLGLRHVSAREEHAGPGIRKCATHVWANQVHQQEGSLGDAQVIAGVKMRCSTLLLRGGGPGTAEEQESTETEPTGGETSKISELERGLGKLGIRERAGKSGAPRAAEETWGDAKFRENMRRAFASRQGLGPAP